MIHSLRNFAAAAVLIVALIGCSKEANKTSPPPIDPAKNVPEASGPPKTADEAVRRVLDGLRQQKARAVWEFLPPSYQTDIQTLVRDVAQRLDDRTWEATVAVWQKARKVLPPKAGALFGQAASNDSLGKSSRPAINPQSLQRLFDSVGECELSDLKRLREVDVGRFLEVTGGDVLQALGALPNGGAMSAESFANLAKVEVTLISSSSDSAVVRMKWPGQEPTEHPYVRVDGYWLPKSLAESWDNSLAEIREQAIAWAEELSQQPEPWNARLKEIDQLLDELAATKSDADARAVYQRGVRQLLAAWIGTPPSATEETPRPQAPERKKKVPDTEEVLPDEK